MDDMPFTARMAQRIELWPVDRLRPYERNARTHSDDQVAKIAASITEFGFNAPILVDSSDGIIAGHGRLLAALSLGMTEVPIVVLDHLTDAQRRAYIIADNQLTDNSWFDEDLLAAELSDLDGEGFDLEVLGFSDEELADLLGDEDPETALDFNKPSRNGEHPTMKPVDLIEYQVRNSCPPGGVVLDLFGGSGTTAIACEASGRAARLMELDPRYVDVIVRRWQSLTEKTATLEATGQTFAEVEARRNAPLQAECHHGGREAVHACG